MSPDEVLAKHDSRRLTQWQEFDKLSPIGALREDVSAATICQTLENLLVVRRPGQLGKPLHEFVFEGDFQASHQERAAARAAAEDPAVQAKLKAYYANAAKAKAAVREKKRQAAEALRAAAEAQPGSGRRKRRRG